MTGLILSIVLVLVLAILFGWLAVRAWRARRAIVKWPGAIAAGLAALLCVIVTGMALLGVYRVYAPKANPLPNLPITGSPEQIARGERLAHLCIGCHSSTGDLPLDGGRENDLAGMGVLIPPNLTPGGPLQSWSDGEIIRAIREGVHQDGRALLLMPSDQYRVMSDGDVQALVAYLRTQPLVAHSTPEMQLNLFGALLMGTGFFPISNQPPGAAPRPDGSQAPPNMSALEHGDYLITLAGCRECHGENLQGGTSQFVPVGPNLPVLVGEWTADQFIETMRTGVDPYGREIDAGTMPWDDFSAAFTDEELRAIYEYIHSR